MVEQNYFYQAVAVIAVLQTLILVHQVQKLAVLLAAKKTQAAVAKQDQMLGNLICVAKPIRLIGALRYPWPRGFSLVNSKLAQKNSPNRMIFALF